MLSHIFIKRPVFALVVSMLLIIAGAIALSGMPIRELPEVDPPVVSIETNYRGASANVVESRITQVIEERISGIEGIESITSSSLNGRSTSASASLPIVMWTRRQTTSAIA